MAHASYGRINSNSSSEKEEPSWRQIDAATLTCGQRIREQFRVRSFFLGHDNPGLFGRAQCGPSVIYLIWRLIWAVYHVSAISISGFLTQFYATREENRIKWFIFLTNWCYLILTCSAILDLIVSVHFYVNKQSFLKGAEAPMPWYCKVLWVQATISNAIGIEISLVYWLLLHDFSNSFNGYRILPFLTHGMNVIYILLNLMVTAMPVRLLHFYQPAVFGIVYVLFSVVYTVCGGSNDLDEPYIYSILDWNNSATFAAILTSGAVVGAMFVHVVIYLIHLLRIFMFRCSRSDGEVMV
ncbi:protein rolling stone-like [Haliotis rubra]|uniref:protein rolling stone-like n=1 Tax=Haliotis rubra TaxID=36100 RepID=UPI001EE62948|nr:protein rolling stone-like [Haliotis rubra]XP_046569549.1 protein rolling stone-like [Haliotis rubra]